jgi:hypothetical protein
LAPTATLVAGVPVRVNWGGAGAVVAVVAVVGGAAVEPAAAAAVPLLETGTPEQAAKSVTSTDSPASRQRIAS